MKHSLDSQSFIESAPQFDGVSAWNIMYKRFNQDSIQNKMLVTVALMNCKMQQNESVEAFGLSQSKFYNKCISLAVSLEDMRAVLFVCGLMPNFKEFETTILLQDKLTYEQVLTDAKAFEDRQKYRDNEDRVKALLVQTYLAEKSAAAHLA